MKYLIKQLISFSICKYAKTVNFCSSYALEQLFIKYLIKQLNSFSICKYAKTVNFCSSYALVDGSLESRTPC